jgi:phosphoglycolate phosphatase
MCCVKLVIFDLDGTIVDSGQTVLRILNNLRSELNLPNINIEYLVDFLSLGGEKLIKKALGHNINSFEYLYRFRNYYLNDSLIGEKLYPGVVSLMENLQEKKIKIGLLTNKPTNLVYKTIFYHNIFKFFDIIKTDDGVLPKKPNPQGLLEIIKETRISNKNTIIIGDSLLDQEVALAANIKFYFHSAGYDDGVILNKDEISFRQYDQLKRIL